jgi:hypothetical protein
LSYRQRYGDVHFIKGFGLDISLLSVELLALLFVVAVFAGFVDTLAGGGGLITVPSLILAGVPPVVALGTNKLQGCMGTATATLMMFRKKKITWEEVRRPMLYAFMGAAIGTLILQFVSSQALSFIIPVVLLVIATYFIFSSRIHMAKRDAVITPSTYEKTAIPAIGFYDGFFGPGTGSFFSLAGVSLRAQTLLEATARAKALNFSTNIASLLVFIVAGKIFWAVGLTMMVGQAIGAWAGSHSLLRIPTSLLRFIIVAVCVAMLVRYALQMY